MTKNAYRIAEFSGDPDLSVNRVKCKTTWPIEPVSGESFKRSPSGVKTAISSAVHIDSYRLPVFQMAKPPRRCRTVFETPPDDNPNAVSSDIEEDNTGGGGAISLFIVTILFFIRRNFQKLQGAHTD